jgi:sterol desaturase/sphingolipid hydroxylase (fatty acid hydroxylase superfamily)
MEKYIEIIWESYAGYFNYLKAELFSVNVGNYFYGLLFISLTVFILEILFPWRKNQPVFRKDFGLDIFYLFFNFFLLNLIFLMALSNVAEQLLIDFFSLFNLDVTTIKILNLSQYPLFVSLFIFFLITDFLQWLTHRMLHRVAFLWKFHKVHHSVQQMGFAAHFRYHWMEPVIYKSILYIPIALIGGFNLRDVYLVHFLSITIGHINHANLGWDYGILKYLFNNPKMHIWHHSKELPHQFGVNFGISLSIWDYIFKTNFIPYDGAHIEIGIEKDEKFPEEFISQELYPLKLKK